MEPNQRTDESNIRPSAKDLATTRTRHAVGAVFVVASVAIVAGIVIFGAGGAATDSVASSASCALPGALAGNSSPGGSSMQPVQLRSADSGLLPPIDVRGRRSLETATFALG